MSPLRAARCAGLPTAAFVAAVAVHFAWVGAFPESDPEQSRWVLLPSQESWGDRYLEAGAHWMGYSYGLASAFAAAAVRRFLRERSCASRRMAVGGMTFTGGLAVAGCFLVGCCGSPMLAVWLGLFGAAFLPFAKPLVAAATTVTVGVGWWMMARADRLAEVPTARPLPCGTDERG